MKTNYLVIFLAVILFTSCQKELDFSTPILPVSGTTACTNNSYMPLTDGNTWNFSQGGVIKSGVVLPGDTAIGGKTYKKLKESQPGFPDNISYYREDNSNLYVYFNLGVAGFVSQNLVRGNAAVGDKWSDTSLVNNIPEIFQYELIAKNITYAVDTLNFTNVYHVRYKVSLDFPPIFNNEVIQVTDAYFARCIGPIRTITQFYAIGLPVNTLDIKLVSYTVR